MELPELIIFEKFQRNWDNYIEVLYLYFSQDFKIKGIEYKGEKVVYIKDPFFQGKEFSFWHIVTKGNTNNERVYDAKRCERIRWPKALIENSEEYGIKTWISQRRSKKGKIQKRLCFCLKDFEYFVVLDIRKGYYLFCTAYPIDEHGKNRIIRDYLSNKKQTPPF